MKFGEAIEALREGRRCARRGWNGKGMYVYLTEGREIPASSWVERTPAQAITPAEAERGAVIIGDHIDMMDARGIRICGWLASQTDMLADDWEVIE